MVYRVRKKTSLLFFFNFILIYINMTFFKLNSNTKKHITVKSVLFGKIKYYTFISQ